MALSMHTWKANDRVKLMNDETFVRCMQYGHRGFNNDVKAACGQPGVVMFVDRAGDVNVMFPYVKNGVQLTINPKLLQKDEIAPATNFSPRNVPSRNKTKQQQPGEVDGSIENMEDMLKKFDQLKKEYNFVKPEFGKLPEDQGDRRYPITVVARKLLSAAGPLFGEQVFTMQIPSAICTGPLGQLKTWEYVKSQFEFLHKLNMHKVQEACEMMRGGIRDMDRLKLHWCGQDEKAIIEHIHVTVIEMENAGRCFNSFLNHRSIVKSQGWPIVLADCILGKLTESDWHKMVTDILPREEARGWKIKKAAEDMRKGERDIVKLTQDVDTGTYPQLNSLDLFFCLRD